MDDIRYTIYDIRYTIYDIRFTIYDIRFTIYDLRIFNVTILNHFKKLNRRFADFSIQNLRICGK